MPSSLLKESWQAGKTSRVIVALGVLVSAVWAVSVAVATLRVIVNAIHEPALPTAYKIPLLILLALVVLVLVIPLPTHWLMYGLLRFDERRRRAAGPKA